MPTRLLLEGPDIEELLTRVRSDYGPRARIVQADKVRVGGLGGFFAKERFEVAVEIDDLLPPDGVDPFLALADRADAEEQELRILPGPPPPEASVGPSGGSSPAAPGAVRSNSTGLGSAGSVSAGSGPRTAAADASSATRAGPPTPTGPPPVETDTSTGADFASALASVRREPAAGEDSAFRPTPVIQSAGTVRLITRPDPAGTTPPLDGKASPPADETAAPVGDPPLAAADASEDPISLAAGDRGAAPVRSTRHPERPPATVASESAEPGRGSGPAVSTPAASGPAVAPAPAVPAGGVASPAFLAPVTTAGESMVSETRMPSDGPGDAADITVSTGLGARPAATSPPRPAAPAAGAPALSAATAPLHTLGLPDVMLTAAEEGLRDPVLALTAALGALPRPPRPTLGAGEVLVLAGEAMAAYATASRLATETGIDQRFVLLAAPEKGGVPVPANRHLSAHEDVVRRVNRLRRSGEPVVLAIDAPLGRRGAAWAREVIEAVDATAVWAVVDAARKPVDLTDQIQRLRRVDALVVHGATTTRDPGSVLGLGVPVAMVDGRRATRAAWTGLLAARLDGDEEDR